MRRTFQTQLRRRGFLRGTAASGALLLGGCGFYPPAEGVAFEPWAPDPDETRPEVLAASAAILAASPHNTQPWLFAIRPDAIEVHADPARNVGALDPLRRELHVGLGCALENLVLRAEAEGRRTDVRYFPGEDPSHVATVTLTAGDPTPSALADAILRRHTNRGEYLDAAPPAGLLEGLEAHATEDGVRLRFVVEREAKRAFRDATLEATRAILDDDEMRDASHLWYRHGPDAIAEHRDGVTIDATGLGSTQAAFGKALGRPSASNAGEYWMRATKERQSTGAAFVVVETEHATRSDELRAGRAYQRMHLWASNEGLGMQPLNQLAEMQDREEELGSEPRFTEMLAAFTNGGRPQMLFRVGVPWDDGRRSPRRPLSWVTL